MTPQQFVGLGIRIVAIWLAFACLNYLVRIPAALEAANAGEKAIGAYGIAAAYAVAALLLWLFPMWTAHKLLPRTNFENTINLQPLEAARVGCALIGLWFFAQGFLDAVWFLFRAFLSTSSQSTYDSLGSSGKLDFAIIVVNLIFGLALILRAGAFASFVVGRTAAPRKDS